MLVWGISSYKRLVGLRRKVVNAWKHLNVQRTRHRESASSPEQEELANVRVALADAVRSYNDLAREYNAAIKVFPNNVVATIGSFRSAELADAPSDPVPPTN
jgi:hypothetical protein